MRNNINIKGNNQVFPYIIEYCKNAKSPTNHITTDGDDIVWNKIGKTIQLFKGDVQYYHDKNDWYRPNFDSMVNTYVPISHLVHTSNIKVYIPTHSISTYVNGVKYMLSAHTWINGYKIDLGSFMFKPTDTYAVTNGAIKAGNNEYYDMIDFDIIDPFYLIYSDNWINFRHNVCDEPLNLNNTGSTLYISLYVVDEYENRYMIKNDIIGGSTSFNFSDYDDFLALKLDVSLDPLGISFTTITNEEFDWLLTYLYETYNITASHSDLKYELMLKSKDAIIPGPTMAYSETGNSNINTNVMSWTYIKNTAPPVDGTNELDRTGVYKVFESWNNFEEGWVFIGSLTVYDSQGGELLTIVSNELPVTQEIFSIYANNGAEKIIDIQDMEFKTYNIVNKKTNNIIQLDRPNESKSNIIQPVFFKVKDLEHLTLHPIVTETISINLDEYKSKVDKFTLQIEGCKFEQIGANSYGILFKITANTLPSTAISGTYYILDDNLELITTGKYTCIR